MPKDAYKRVNKSISGFRLEAIPHIYKKVDSTLRGNIGAELDALMDAASVDKVVFSPAYPANKRTVKDGVLLLDGVPVANTEFAEDPWSPVKESHIPSLLRSQTKRAVGHVPLTAVLKDRGSFLDAVKEEFENGNEIVVVDATDESHLHMAVDAAARLDATRLLSGSAGLALALPKGLDLMKKINPVLIMAGSLSRVTRVQVDRVVDSPSARAVNLDANLLSDEEVSNVVSKCIEGIRSNMDVVVRSPERVPGKEKEIARTMGEVTSRVLNQVEVSGMVLTGGDIASAVSERLGVNAIRILQEVQPGIPLGEFVGGDADGMKVVTKAGGFGDDDALVSSILMVKDKQKVY